jgi:hypothetical protein
VLFRANQPPTTPTQPTSTNCVSALTRTPGRRGSAPGVTAHQVTICIHRVPGCQCHQSRARASCSVVGVVRMEPVTVGPSSRRSPSARLRHSLPPPRRDPPSDQSPSRSYLPVTPTSQPLRPKAAFTVHNQREQKVVQVSRSTATQLCERATGNRRVGRTHKDAHTQYIM